MFQRDFWFNDNNRYNVKYVSAENEAWTKSWPDQSDPKKNHFEYISNFEWFDIWKNHHGQIIIKKISPFLIFISLTFIILVLFNWKNSYLKNNNNYKIIQYIFILRHYVLLEACYGFLSFHFLDMDIVT